MNPFVHLTRIQLERLHAALLQGPLKYGVSADGLRQQGLSPEQAGSLEAYVINRDLSSVAVAAIIEAVAQTRTTSDNLALAQSLVVTGPMVPPTEILKTGSRFIEVVQYAKKELMLATFALYQGEQILAPIHAAMTENPALDVTVILNIPRKYGDTTISAEIVESFKGDLFSKHWPWNVRPNVYYFPDALHLKAGDRASMHSKFVIADEERCFITSANFTQAAQTKNIEVGVELKGSYEPRILSAYFKEMIRRSFLTRLS